MVEHEQKYILLHDRVGENVERSILSLGMTKTAPTQVLKGEILIALPEGQQPNDSQQVLLTGVERKNLRVECPTSDLARVTGEEADLLLGISSALERHRIFHQRNRLEAGKKIIETTKVLVKLKELPKEVPGVVWYKGPLPTAGGTMFGVELTEHKGRGTSNGEFRNHRYFTCPDDCGVFVSLDKLTLQDDSLESKKSSHSVGNKIKNKVLGMFGTKGGENGKQMDQKEMLSIMTEHVDKRVVTYIGETPVRGFLRALGTSSHGTAMAGIELDKRYGGGTGIYQGKQLFFCKKDHAIFVPLASVIPEKHFDAVSNGEQNEQEKRFPEEETQKGETWPDEVSAKSLVYDNSRIQASASAREFRRSNSLSSTSSSTSTEEALKAAGIPADKTESFLKEQEMRMAELKSGYGSRKRDNMGAELEKLDNVNENLNFQSDHFQAEKTSKVSRTHSTSNLQTGNSQFFDTGFRQATYGSVEAQWTGHGASSEQPSSLSAVLVRGATSPVRSSASFYNKDRMTTRSMTKAKSQDVVADCDLNSTQQPVDRILDETANQMREATSKLQDVNMDTFPAVPATVQGNSDDIQSVESGVTTSIVVSHSHLGLEVGSMAEIPLSDGQSTRYGVIRWIGSLPELNGKLVAGLELEEEQSACSDGTFGGRRYFSCPAGRGFFVLLQHCRRDLRFSPELADTNLHSGKAFGSIDSPPVTGIVPPLEKIPTNGYGQMRGIQGHHNSCYLDATLFSMFAFTSIFDSLLHRKSDDNDLEQYEQVQTVLKDNIVNPLRRDGFVRADRVLELRKLLDELGSVTGLVNEEKDPEEFLNTLLQQVFKAEPFLHLKYNNRCEGAHFYQVIPEKEEGIEVPTVQSLLEQSFLAADIKLREVPSCLILQMPRFGSKYKMYEHILISPVLDVTHLVESVPHDCVSCGENVAEFECKHCSQNKMFATYSRIIGLCRECSDRLHGHAKRRDHKLTPIAIPREYSAFPHDMPIQRQEMELFAVVCIQTSHYVAFVKCGAGPSPSWCFFDSMADRKGERNGYNIPSITPCPEVEEWLNYPEKKITDAKRDGKIPDLIKRLLGDSYLCMYQNQEVGMYK